MTHPALITEKDPDIYQILSHNLYHFSNIHLPLYPDKSFDKSEQTRFYESIRLHTLIFKHRNSELLILFCNDQHEFFTTLISIFKDLYEPEYSSEEALKLICENVTHHFKLDQETRSSIPELIRWIAFDLVRRFHREENYHIL